MEQIIESFGLNPKIFLAEIVNFLIVLGVLYWFVFRKVSTMLDERAVVIKQGVDNAEQAQQTLKDAEEEKRGILHKAGEDATAEIKAAIETAKQREGEIVEEANTRSNQIIQEAQKKGELLKDKLVDSSKEDIAKMIVLGAEKVLASK